MKSIETLARLYKFFGWLRILIGFLPILTVGFAISLSITLSVVQGIFGGVMFLVIAQALLSKEKWAWYMSIILTVIITPGELLLRFFTGGFNGLAFIFGIAFSVLFLVLLIKGRSVFVEQPPETFSQWLQKKPFVFALFALLVSVLISSIVFLGFRS